MHRLLEAKVTPHMRDQRNKTLGMVWNWWVLGTFLTTLVRRFKGAAFEMKINIYQKCPDKPLELATPPPQMEECRVQESRYQDRSYLT